MSEGLFRYDEAFARNIGWVTEAEQASLRGKRVAIAGVGGVGGVHLLSLARLGVGAFHVAEMDTFDLVNFNRQAGAMMSTLGRPKVEVMIEMARDINPELDIQVFGEGVNAGNLDAFLDGWISTWMALISLPSRPAATPSTPAMPRVCRR
jgi:tRNA A37 threonylcarbamoyladenosine dehydratase